MAIGKLFRENVALVIGILLPVAVVSRKKQPPVTAETVDRLTEEIHFGSKRWMSFWPIGRFPANRAQREQRPLQPQNWYAEFRDHEQG